MGLSFVLVWKVLAAFEGFDVDVVVVVVVVAVFVVAFSFFFPSLCLSPLISFIRFFISEGFVYTSVSEITNV